MKKDGFIAIVSLLIITTVSMVIAMNMLRDGVENASLSLSSIYYEDARLNAGICLEDMLMRMKLETRFSQSLDYVLDSDENCTTSISWQLPTNPTRDVTETLGTVTIQGVAHDFQRNFIYQVKVKQYKVHYTDGTYQFMNVVNPISSEELTS